MVLSKLLVKDTEEAEIIQVMAGITAQTDLENHIQVWVQKAQHLITVVEAEQVTGKTINPMHPAVEEEAVEVMVPKVQTVFPNIIGALAYKDTGVTLMGKQN